MVTLSSKGVPMERSNRVCLKGGFFGELALTKEKGKSGQMRQATVMAMEDCKFAILNKSSYDVVIFDPAHSRRHQ